MTTRAVLYARVSSDDTRNDGRNLRGQLDMCREYALKHGWSIVAELPEDDRGASGASLELPQLNRLIEMARASEIDVVIVREIDRFSRRLAKQLIIEEELKRFGVRIEYVLGEYPDTPEGNLMKNVKASVAEYEREKIAQRMTRGRRLVVKNGGIMLHGNKPPYGYLVSSDGKNLVIHEPEAEIIRLIFTWYAEGDENGHKLGSNAIAHRLTEMRVPTWEDIHGYNSKKRGSGKWSAGVIVRTIGRETYLGRWHYGRRKNGQMNPKENWLELEVPALVTPELWKKAQAQKEHNKERSKRNGKCQYLFARRIKCGVCGTRVYGVARPTKNKLYLYYYCNMKRSDYAIKRECNLGDFRADHVDSLVWEWVRSLLADPVTLNKGLDVYRAQQQDAMRPLVERLSVAEKLLDENRRQLDRLLDLYLSGDFPREMLVERKTQLERTVDLLEQERVGLTAQLSDRTLSKEQVESVQRYATQVAEGLDQADVDFTLRKQIVEELNVRVTLTIEDGQRVIHAQCVLGKQQMVLNTSRPIISRQSPNGSEENLLSIATTSSQNEV